MKVQYISPHQGTYDGFGTSSEALKKYLNHSGVQLVKDKQDIAFVYHQPYILAKMPKNQKKVLYTMFESTKIPPDWPDLMRLADKVIVPSRFLQEVFLRYGVVSEVVPLGIDDEVYEPLPQKKDYRRFTFLHYTAFNARKGFLELHSAFTKTFDPMSRVYMIYKVTGMPNRFPLDVSKTRNIEIIDQPYTWKQMVKLIEKCDCFVFPSQGEGFGLPPLEAAACDRRVIATDAHGHSEWFDDRYFTSVKHTYHRARYSREEFQKMDLGCFAKPDVNDLANKMRQMVDNWRKDFTHYKAMARATGHYVRNNYNYRITAERLSRVIKSVVYANQISAKSKAGQNQA